jgi:predicted transcriptional regulator
MIIRSSKITIYKSRRPSSENVNEELQWFCDSLGIFGDRDKDKSCFRMFIILLKSLHDTDGLTSDEISEKVGLSRGTVVHHLHKLMGSGLVVNQVNRYTLRVNNLNALVDEVERDIIRTMEELRQAAGEIDKRLEL